jgi:hypothetical protein
VRRAGRDGEDVLGGDAARDRDATATEDHAVDGRTAIEQRHPGRARDRQRGVLPEDQHGRGVVADDIGREVEALHGAGRGGASMGIPR